MLGHDWPRLADVNHLAPIPVSLRCRFHAGAIASAGRWDMHHDRVGMVHQVKRHTRMPWLAATLLTAALAQAAGQGPLGWPIIGRRSMTVVAIRIQPGFPFRQARRQHLNLLLQLGLVRQQLRQLIRVGRQRWLDPGHQCVWPGLIDERDIIP